MSSAAREHLPVIVLLTLTLVTFNFLLTLGLM